MKLRPLPFITELEQLSAADPKAAQERRDAAMRELARCPGFQVVLSALHYEQHEALEALRYGRGDLTRQAGAANAITNVLVRLAALFPDGTVPDMEPEEEYDLPVYDDRPSFDIPYPTLGRMTADNA